MSALLVVLLLQGAVPQAESPEVDHVQSGASARHYGVHLGLNATAAFDAELGGPFYALLATQLTGLGTVVAPHQGLVLSAFVMGGVTFPIAQGQSYRLNFDAGPHVTLAHSFPTNMLSVGAVAGLRLIYDSGLSFGLKLPLVGYGGSIDQPRGSLLYYYVAAVPTVPVLSAGYSF